MYSFTLPSGRVQSIAYDTAGRVSGVSSTYNSLPENYASSFAYFPNGALQNVSLGPNGLYQQYCQDTNGRLQMVGIRLASANRSGNTAGCANNADPLNLAFSYGSTGANNGNLISEMLLPLNAAQTFTYDAYNRLSTAKEGNTIWSQTYKCDVNGNANTSLGNRYVSATSGLSLVPSSFTPTTNTNFNSSNQLIIQGSTYDKAGNLKTMGAYSFTYDAENRQVTNTVSGSNTYSYDGEGRRVQKVTGSVSTVYVYDAKSDLVAEYASAPSGQLETTYLTTDHLGSTRLATTADGTVLGYHDYLPFGEEIPATIGGRSGLYGSAGDGVTHKFTGQERDAETASTAAQGLDFFETRYYSGTQGRFTSPDEFPGWNLQHSEKEEERKQFADYIGNPQNWNMYTYVLNNPLNHTDPTGMLGCQVGNQKYSTCTITVVYDPKTSKGTFDRYRAEQGRQESDNPLDYRCRGWRRRAFDSDRNLYRQRMGKGSRLETVWLRCGYAVE